MRPDHGGRLEFKLAEASETGARYLLTAFTRDAEAQATAFLDSSSGAVEITQWHGGAPPAWLETLARALLRTVLRRKSSEAEWPRRLTRWRPEPPP